MGTSLRTSPLINRLLLIYIFRISIIKLPSLFYYLIKLLNELMINDKHNLILATVDFYSEYLELEGDHGLVNTINIK